MALNAYGLELVNQGLGAIDEVQRICSGGDKLAVGVAPMRGQIRRIKKGE